MKAHIAINVISTAAGETHYGEPYFTAEDGEALTDGEKNALLTKLGITAPVFIDPPALYQTLGILTCTNGNWKEHPEPRSFSYKWQIDGADTGIVENTYLVDETDVGRTFLCIVTATHQFGSTSVPSNELVAIEPGI